MRHLAALILAATLGGCGTLPDVAEPRQPLDTEADYPSFVPIGLIAMDRAEADAADLETEETLEARVSGLRARAARLRGADIP